MKVGVEALRSGSSLEAVQAAVEYMEDTEVFNAGRGSSLTSDGRLQLDAAVMVASGEALTVSVTTLEVTAGVQAPLISTL